jgi:effector-binding domain-containing protein
LFLLVLLSAVGQMLLPSFLAQMISHGVAEGENRIVWMYAVIMAGVTLFSCVISFLSVKIASYISTELELILTLRKIGLSIDEIKDYSSRPSDESFTEMMTKKKKLIDESIEQLLSAQAFLEQKAERLKIGMYSQHGTIERCTLPERKIIFSSPISGEYDEDDFSIAAEFSLRLKKLFHLYDNFGSCISIEDIQKNSFNSYHSFFAYCPQTSDVYDEILPAGTYLRAFCIGDWGKLPEIYRSILYYARKHNLTLTGYAYEEGLNEMSIKDRSDYITMITIKCD